MSSAGNKFISKEEATPILNGSEIFSEHEESRFALGVFSPESIVNYQHNSSEELYLKLRSNVYVKQTRMLSEDVVREDNTEIDEDDERSIHFVVFENRMLGRVAAIACMRLIEKKNEEILPIEDFFSESFEEKAADTGSVEVSRFIISHEESRHARTAKREVMTAGMAHIISNDLGPIYAVVEPIFERDLRMFGVPTERIAEPKIVPEYNDENLGLEINRDKFKQKLGEEALKRLTIPVGSFIYWGQMPDKKTESSDL